jgi:hypothetical protein
VGCILCNPQAVLRHLSIIEVLAAFTGTIIWVDTATPPNERQQSVNDFVCCTLYNPITVLRHLSIIEVLAAVIGNIVCVDTVAPQNERQQSLNSASTQHQQSVNRASTKCQQSVNRVSTLLGVASCIIQGLCYGIDP